ncbi:hypothetical protein [Mycoplasma yeatsii]|uniref:hypothetical protein n=1 Tax=Mycoplasma yeatsii TaxID=51365 RepID=UPI0005B23B45|nr:hypothetical protein [Mycoplasma yeatsii]AJM71992.1 liporotein [Mycoplasma yeatsii GM274B]
MKKLITLLSTFTFAATAMTGVVSCKKEEQRSNSQFIKGDGEFDIDAKALLSWYKEWNGVNQDEGFINKFYNILAVGLLKGIAEKGEFKLPTGDDAKQVGWDDSLNTELENLLGKKDGSTPNSLYSFAHSALKDKRDNEFKDKHKDYIKFLEDKFKGVKKDQASLENAFLSDYILNDPSNSAFIRLKNTLMFNSTISNSLWRKGIQTNDLDINVIVKKFAGVDVYKNKNTLEDLANAVKEVFSNDSVNWNDSSITSFTDLVNSVGGIDFGKDNNNNISITYSSPEQIKNKIKEEKDKTDWIKTILKRFSNKDDKSNKGIIEFSNFVQTGNYDGPSNFVNFEGLRPRSWSKIVKQIPVLNGKDLKRDDIKGNFGSITDSQKFSIDNYFNTEKPVMVSDLIFTFANSKKKEDVEKQLSLEALIPTSSTGNDLTKELVNRFQGIAATLQAYVNDDQKEDKNEVPDTAGLARFDTIFRGATRAIRADVNGGAKSFKDWTEWDKENTYHKVNKTGDLLTISDTSFSNVAKYSIYDFITNQDNNSNTWSWKGTEKLNEEDLIKYGLDKSQASGVISALDGHEETKTTIANVIKLFEKINQKASNDENEDNNGKNMNKNMFTVLNKDNGIIAYIDGDGLHITKVDGYKLMNIQPSDKKEIDINKQTAVLKKIDSLYTSEFGKDLVPYLVNSMLKEVKPKTLLGEGEAVPAESATVNGVADKVWDWSESDKKNSTSVSNMGVEIEYLNNNIKNNYERFLVNTSLIDNTKTKTFYNTNILNEASKATDSSDKNLGSQASWLLGLFSKVFKNNEIINKIIKIPAEENVEADNKKLGSDVKAEFDHLVTKIILDRQKMEQTASIGQFSSDNRKWVKSILENWKTQSKDQVNKKNFIPDQAIDLTSDDGKRFKALLNSDIFNPNQELKKEKEES